MENTLENKAKFFAQYWGQSVLTRPHCGAKKWILGEEVSIQSALSKQGYDYQYFLELKPLSLITDEDASILAEEHGIYIGNDPLDFFKSIEEFKRSISGQNCFPVGFFDYIRSKGYALPWMGLSVETMIEYGWIKLKEN